MNLNFAAALHLLGPDAAFRIANERRPGGDYLFNTFLPERNRTSYSVESGSMTIRATMAGLVGMDSPYAPGGVMEVSTFIEQSAKIANTIPLPEQVLRQLQDMLLRTGQGNTAAPRRLADEALNFIDKLVVQAHLDTFEYLRGEAMIYGAIDWTFNQKRLQVNYGIPAGNLLANRTGTAHYGGSASAFWTDWKAARTIMKGPPRAAIAHPDTIDLIIANAVNNILVTAQDAVGGVQFTRYISLAGNTVRDPDQRYRSVLTAYSAEAEILDLANPGRTVLVPFMPRGKILLIGNPIPRGYQVGQGGTEDPDRELPIGYTHLAPTVEGQGRPGRWARLYTPEQQQWRLIGDGVTNGLPVIEAPEKIVVMSTDMA
jgi:hypothetical protein